MVQIVTISDSESDAPRVFADTPLWSSVEAADVHQEMDIWHFYPFDDTNQAATHQAKHMRKDLVDLLTKVKKCFGLGGYVTANEMEQVIRRIFRHGFQSTRPHPHPTTP